MALLASCMVNALAFFDAILQDLMQDAAFSFANRSEGHIILPTEKQKNAACMVTIGNNDTLL